jgi:SAM-dependent methyltransferase
MQRAPVIRHSDLAWLARLREQEISIVHGHFPVSPGRRLLEIGGGTGHQARWLVERGWEVESVDLETSVHAARVFPVRSYDGRRLPFADESFDVVFSSNVLEHVPHLDEFEGELARVLKPDGRAIHVLPTHRWRLWTSLVHYPALPKTVARMIEGRVAATQEARGAPGPAVSGQGRTAVQRLRGLVASPRHGERGTVLSEYATYFRPSWWERHFLEHGFVIEERFPLRLFYTGNMLLEQRLSLETRSKLADVLGSSSICFVLKRRPAAAR